MPKSHPDPFAALEPARPKLEPYIIDGVRAHLHQRLALVKAAEATPWTDMLTIIEEDNGVRFKKDLLPPEEGEALWAAFDVEMDRLYAIMNEGLDLDELYKEYDTKPRHLAEPVTGLSHTGCDAP